MYYFVNIYILLFFRRLMKIHARCIPISDVPTSFHVGYFAVAGAAALCRIFVVASFSVKSRNIINEFNLKLNWCTRAFSLTSNLLYARTRIRDDRCILRYYEMRFVRYPVITGGINLAALEASRWRQCYIYIFIFIITSPPDGAGYIFKVAITIHEVNSLNISSLYIPLPVALEMIYGKVYCGRRLWDVTLIFKMEVNLKSLRVVALSFQNKKKIDTLLKNLRTRHVIIRCD